MSEQRVPTKDEMPDHAQVAINLFKYQHFEPYVMTFGTVDRQREKAEEIVEWWPGWIKYCLEWCNLIIADAEKGGYDRPGIAFPMEAWKAQRDVFQQAMDDGKFVEAPE